MRFLQSQKQLVVAAVLALFSLCTSYAEGIQIERVMRDFQARHKLVTGSYVEWPKCKTGATPAPQFPKDGFYGDLNEDHEEAVRIIRNLVENVYGDTNVFTSFINAPNGFASIDNATAITNFTPADFQFLAASNVTAETFASILTNVANDISKLNFLKVQGTATNNESRVTQTITTNLSDDSCADVIDCITSNHPSTLWGSMDTWGEDCGNYQTVTGFGALSIWNVFLMSAGEDSPNFPGVTYSGYIYNNRGKITADLREYSRGSARVYLKLNKVYYIEDPIEHIFSEDRPTAADEGKYGYWHSGELALGQVSTTGYVTGSDGVPIDVPDCPVPPLGGNAAIAKSWELEDAIVVVAPDFSVSPDDQDCCNSCECEPGAEKHRLHSVAVNISLGNDQFGSAGFLALDAELPSVEIYTPAALRFSVGSSVERITNSAVTHIQFKSTQMLADILTNSLYSYTMSFYLATDAGTTDTNGFYQPTNSPYTIVTVENPDGGSATNRLRVTRISDGGTNITEYAYDAPTDAWEMVTGGGLRKESISSSWNPDQTVRTEIMTVKDASNVVVFKEQTTYFVFPWGEERVTNIVDPDGAALTSTWSYYTNAATDGGGYRFVKESVDSRGHWQRYQYDEVGRETNRVTQFLSSAIGSAASTNRVTETIYSTNAPQITVVEKLFGTEISRSYKVISPGEVQEIRCQTVGAAWNATNNLVTTSIEYTNGSFAGELKRVINPNGTVQIYQFATNSTTKTTTVLSGVADPGSETNILRGTISVTVIGLDGKTESASTWEKSNGTDYLTSQEVYTYLDDRRRSYQVVGLDGRTNTFNYACCGLETEIDKDGVTTTHLYDDLKRNVGTMRNGIITTNWMDAMGSVLGSYRVGTNGSLITLNTAAYDVAGRMTNSLDALENPTLYSETNDLSGQMIRTTTFADGGQKKELFAKDGALLMVFGSAVRPVRYVYGIESSGPDAGRFFTQEIKLDGNGDDMDEWTVSYSNPLGAAYKRVFSDSASSETFFDSFGQRSKEVDPDGVANLFIYDAMGEMTISALDMDRDDAVDFSGTDRISFTTNDVISAHGTTVRRSRQYVWATNEVDSMTLVGTREASVDGLKTWSHAFGLTNSSETLFPAAGVQQVISTRPDGSYNLSQFTNGLLVTVTEYDSGANQIGGTSFGYDAHGRQSSVTDARNGTTTFAYNDADQVLSVTTPVPGTGQSAQTTANNYDEMGRVWKTTLPDNTSVTNEFYLTGDLKKTYGSRTYPVQYVYDAQGRMTNMTTWQDYPSGGAAITRWLFDERGFMTNKLYADNLGPSYAYSAGGRLQSRLWARGVETDYGYNNAGQVETVNYSDSTAGMTNSYDRLGRLVGVVNGTNSTTLLYSEAGQLLSETCNGFTVTNSYDALLRRTVLAVDGYTNTVTHYGYDLASRLAGVTNGTYSATYSYHANSPLVSAITFRDGLSTRMITTKNFDLLNRLTQISSAPSIGSPITFAYGYNSANQRTSVTNGETRTVYGYDPLGQVTSARKYWTSDGTPVPGQQFEYGFDDIGNRNYAASGGGEYGENLRHSYYEANELNQYEARTVPGYVNVVGSATNAAHVTVNSEATVRKGDNYRAELAVNNGSAAVFVSITNLAVLKQGTNADIVTNITGNLFLPQTPEIFLHDADGNLTNDGRWVYTWDAENRLIGMVGNSGIPAEAKKKLDFAYDYRSRRTHKDVADWNGAAYVADYSLKFVYDDWNLVAELNETNAVLRSYTWGTDLSGTMRGAGGVGGLVMVNLSGAGTHLAAVDGNGNVGALIRGVGGEQVATYEYGPFNETITCVERTSLPNPLRFSTKYFDFETEQVYYGYRYSKRNGNWLSRDPIGEQGGVNLYGFVDNDPINSFDPYGLDKIHLTYITKDFGIKDQLWAGLPTRVENLTEILADVKAELGKEIDPEGNCGNCLMSITITTHSGMEGYVGFSPIEGASYGESDYYSGGKFSNETAASAFAELKQFFCKDGKIILMQCNAGGGEDGTKTLRNLSGIIGVPVVAPQVATRVGRTPKCTKTAFPDGRIETSGDCNAGFCIKKPTKSMR